jgi:hypothetical protein
MPGMVRGAGFATFISADVMALRCWLAPGGIGLAGPVGIAVAPTPCGFA